MATVKIDTSNFQSDVIRQVSLSLLIFGLNGVARAR